MTAVLVNHLLGLDVEIGHFIQFLLGIGSLPFVFEETIEGVNQSREREIAYDTAPFCYMDFLRVLLEYLEIK